METFDLKTFVNHRWFLHKNNSIQKGNIVHQFDLSDEYAFCVCAFYLDSGKRVLYGYPMVKNRVDLDLMNYPEHHALFMNALFQKKIWSGGNATLKIHYYDQEAFEKPFENSIKQNLEQSNSSILFQGGRFLKWFRLLNAGEHPEVEMGVFLQQHHSKDTARILAHISYDVNGESYVVGVIESALQFENIAWDYFGENPSEEKACLLGTQLASLHHTLLAMEGEFKNRENNRLEVYWKAFQANLKQSESQLQGRSLEAANAIQSKWSLIEEYVKSLEQVSFSSPVSRIHGDLHLGQILYKKDQFFFIDFEGEPIIPLNERREKRSVLFDVACMIRSFRYAKAFFKWSSSAALEWAFLKGYGVESSDELRFFLFQKTLYEASYELNSRPDWFYIPAEDLLNHVLTNQP